MLARNIEGKGRWENLLPLPAWETTSPHVKLSFMRTVVPSQIVKFIDRTFPYVNRDVHDNSHVLTLTPDIRGGLMGVVELVALVPARLIVDANALAQITLSIELIRTAVREAEQLTLRDRSLSGQQQLRPFVYPGGHESPTDRWNPVMAIRHALAKCADEAPAVGSNALAFVPQDDLRRTLETDVESVRTALKNGEWKAATVLSGSIVEALLLWAIQRENSSKIGAAVVAAFQAGALGNKNLIPIRSIGTYVTTSKLVSG